ncbi:MAG: cytochrome P450 [Cyclobacteriaceae bacterium]
MAADHLWKPFDRVHIANPYAMYKRLREEDPVHFSQTREWIITRYEDTRNVLRNSDFLVGNRFEWLKKGIGYFKYKDLDFSNIEAAMKGFILFLNPPHHTRIRKFIHQVWNSREVSAIIQHNLDTLLSHQSESIDLVKDLGKPLPAMTIGKILGLPESDYIYLKEQGTVMIKALDLYISFKDIMRVNEAAGNFISYFRKIVEHKQKNPDQGIISKLIELNAQEKVLDGDELISTCILLFIAGEETSVSLMSTGLYHLISRPHELDDLRSNPGKIATAIEELIRYDAPVQIVGRIAGEDCELNGKTIRKGETLTICLGSANRDPEVFEKADEFIVDREPNKHLGFGGGAHYCMGDWLARIQTEMMIRSLLERYKTIEMKDVAPKWNNNLAIRCLTELPAKLR